MGGSFCTRQREGVDYRQKISINYKITNVFKVTKIFLATKTSSREITRGTTTVHKGSATTLWSLIWRKAHVHINGHRADCDFIHILVRGTQENIVEPSRAPFGDRDRDQAALEVMVHDLVGETTSNK